METIMGYSTEKARLFKEINRRNIANQRRFFPPEGARYYTVQDCRRDMVDVVRRYSPETIERVGEDFSSEIEKKFYEIMGQIRLEIFGKEKLEKVERILNPPKSEEARGKKRSLLSRVKAFYSK